MANRWEDGSSRELKGSGERQAGPGVCAGSHRTPCAAKYGVLLLFLRRGAAYFCIASPPVVM